MDIYFFTDSKPLRKKLASLMLKKKFTVVISPVADLRSICKKIMDTSLVYLDISGCSEIYQNELKICAKNENIFFGIIDTKGAVSDIARLYFSGAADYIRKAEIPDNVNEKRFAEVINYLEKYRKDYPGHAAAETALPVQKTAKKIIPSSGWQDIKPGNEYTFSIMYIELDNEKELEKKFGRKNFKEAFEVFTSYIQKQVNAFSGRLWYWSTSGGIVLFPFDGNNCPSVFCGFVLRLSRHIHNVEESLFPSNITFKIALHLGNIQYFEKETGEIISDTINSVFHIGKKYTKPDEFYLTEEVISYAPAQLKNYITSVGSFEGRKIFRMKHFRFAEEA